MILRVWCCGMLLCRMSHDEKSLIKHWHIGMFNKMLIDSLFFLLYFFLDSGTNSSTRFSYVN